MMLYQENEQERAGILTVTSVQTAVTFPEIITAALVLADFKGEQQYREARQAEEYLATGKEEVL